MLNKIPQPYKLRRTALYDILEYIESTGTQYIDSGLTLNGSYTFELECKHGANTGAIISAQNVAIRTGFLYHGTGKGLDYFWTDAGYNSLSMPNIDANQKVKIIQDKKHINITQGSVVYNATYSGSITTNTNHIFIFNYQSDASYKYGILYNCKIKNGNTLLRDFIAAKRVSDNAIGLYDKVNNVFYANTGTGTFVGGHVIGHIY